MKQYALKKYCTSYSGSNKLDINYLRNFITLTKPSQSQTHSHDTFVQTIFVSQNVTFLYRC